jgi:hypothetical protein
MNDRGRIGCAAIIAGNPGAVAAQEQLLLLESHQRREIRFRHDLASERPAASAATSLASLLRPRFS